MATALIVYRLPDGRSSWVRVPRWQFSRALRLMFSAPATDRVQ